MPKSRKPGRSKPSTDAEAKPREAPDRGEVERAIEAIVERLAPKRRKPKTDRKARASLRVVSTHPIP